MNNCAKYEDLCSLCVDGLLTDAEETELMDHLQECSACREYLDELKEIKNNFNQLDTEFPENLHEHIMSAVCTEVSSRTVQYRQPKHRAPMFTMIGAAAAAIVMVMSGALGDIVNKNHGVVEPTEGAVAVKDKPAASDKKTLLQPAEFSADGGAQKKNPSSSEQKPQKADSQTSKVQTSTKETPKEPTKAAPRIESKPATRSLMIAPQTEEANSSSPETILAAPPPDDDNSSDSASISSAEDAIVIPDSIVNERFAFCVIARGTGKMPEIEGTLVSGDIAGNEAYFTVSNSLTFLEKLMDNLSKAGYEPVIDKSTLVAQDKNAEAGLVILIKNK